MHEIKYKINAMMFFFPVLKELDEEDAEKLQTRKWVVSGVLDSEKGYVECLELLRKVQHLIILSIIKSNFIRIITSLFC